MRRSALAGLPAALLAAFIGVLVVPHTARAASPTFAVQGDEVSLRRPDSSQFTTTGSRGSDPAARSATMSDAVRTGPGPDEPTTLVDGSDPDTDKAVWTALNVAQTVIEVAAAVVVAVFLIRMVDVIH